MKFIAKTATATAIALVLSGAAAAQDTSSALRGKITTPFGDAAQDVKITVVHVPTGTVKQITTNENGVFKLSGLRVGGPYKILVDSEKYRDTSAQGIMLQLGQTFRFSTELEALNIETIAVTGQRLAPETGAGSSTYGLDIIENMPSFNRDMKDVARLNPLASVNGKGELVIAGNNPRSNSISVDGIGQNDDFGLQFGGYATGQPPVSMDAIEQISVDVVPFSASKGGFSGGSINAVTKSGTNEFKGSVFYEFKNPSLAGDNYINDLQQYAADVKNDEGKRIHKKGDNILDTDGHRTFKEKKVASISTQSTLGLTLGGPLIEDELFFFVNYEQWQRTEDMDYGFAGSGKTHEFDTSAENFQKFLTILDDTYGLTDSLGGNPEDKDRKMLTKISWNINEDQRFDITYQWQDNKDDRNHATSGQSISLNSQRYTYHTRSSNVAAKLYSNWSDDFSTQLSLTLKDVSSRSLTNSDIGSVYVEEGYKGPSYKFGRDSLRHANLAENKNLTLALDATYLLDEHQVSFGAKIERLSLYNLFAKNSMGSWQYDSLKDFAAGKLGSYKGSYDFKYDNAYTNIAEDTAYDTVRYTTAIYAEDTFDMTDDLEVTVGVRYERLSSSDKPTLNPGFVKTYGYSNQQNLDGAEIIMPRLNFKYFASDALTVSGGVGRFSGGIPNVWFNNPFQADGITLVSVPDSAVNTYFKANPLVTDFSSVPQELQDSLLKGTGSTNYTDPNFKLPSDWRAQLAFNYLFDIEGIADGFSWSTEFIYSIKKDEPVWLETSRTALDDNGDLQYLSDGQRLIQGSIYQGDLAQNSDIMLTNAEQDGRSKIFSTSLANNFDNGLSFTASYTFQDVNENTPGSASTASGNYKHYVMVNRNQPFTATGHYEIENSFKLSLGYATEFVSGYETRFNLFFERHSGRPFSYTMGMYKDGQLGDQKDFYSNSAYLAYIPSGPDDANVDWDYKRNVSWDELKTALDRAGIDACGCVLDRNTHRQPWVTELDLSIQQQLPAFSDDHKATLYFTIDNLANLINDKWGHERRLKYSSVSLYDFGGISDDGKYRIERTYKGYDVRNATETSQTSSAWQVKFGVRYKF